MDIKSFSSGARIALSDLDILNLKRSDFIGFTLCGKNKTRINLRYNTGKGKDKEYMFYAFSEIVSRFQITSGKLQASFILNKASLNIEWVTILSLIEPGDEIELLWCMDWDLSDVLIEHGLYYDCVRIVIYKADHRQHHIRLHTAIGNEQNRLIKLFQ